VQRERWRSRIGFIAATAGSAIGLGNIWRFPVVAARNGGGAFLLVYAAIVAFIGIPMLMAELVLGKHSRTNAVSSFGRVSGNHPWALAGFFPLITSMVILSYYSVISGWVLFYLWSSISGMLLAGTMGFAGFFTAVQANGPLNLLLHGCFMVLTAIIVSRGVGRGIERANKVMMPAIAGLLLILVVRTLTLPGAMQGVNWLLRLDVTHLSFGVVLDALGQAFFSLSLGIGAIVTYGSYLQQDADLIFGSSTVAVSDSIIALLAGLIVIPALFAFRSELPVGPGLAFVSLPAVFLSMPLPRLWATSFFLALAFAALSSSVSMLEVSVAYTMDAGGWTRVRGTVACGAAAFVLGVPSAASSSWLARYSLFGRNFLEGVDFAASNFLLPFTGLLTVLFVGWVWGGGKASREAIDGNHPSMRAVWRILIKFLAPLVIGYVLVGGLLLRQLR